MATTPNYGWPLPDKDGIQRKEIDKIAQTLGAIDTSLKGAIDGLGTASSKTAQTTVMDTGAGRLMMVGAFGLGREIIATQTGLNSYQTPGSYITPASGLSNLPAGWGQGRHVINVAGGSSFAIQTITGVTANAGRTAVRTWNGSAWSAWQEGVYKPELDAAVAAAIASLVNGSPEALDTLQELAAALGNDPNFATTVMTEIGKKLNSSTYTAADILAKLLTVDGAASGLDADLLDGQQGAYYRDLGNATGTLNGVSFGSGTASSPTDLSRHIALFSTSYGFSVTSNRLNYIGSSTATKHDFYGGGVLFGSISASGFEGTASNANQLGGRSLNDGAVASTVVGRDSQGDIRARLFRSEYATTNTTVNFIMTQIETGAGNNYLRPSTPAQVAAALASAGLVPTSRQVIAGNGMSGGGSLSGNVTVTMGTPGSITNNTGNVVGATTHTHALGFTAAEVYTGSDVNNTNFPIGHTVACWGNGVRPARNSIMSVGLSSSANHAYDRLGAGGSLAGIWRCRGETTNDCFLMQRVS